MSRCHFCPEEGVTVRQVPIRMSPGGPVASYFEGPICDRDARMLENGRPT